MTAAERVRKFLQAWTDHGPTTVSLPPGEDHPPVGGIYVELRHGDPEKVARLSAADLEQVLNLQVEQVTEVPRGALVVIRTQAADLFVGLEAEVHHNLAERIGHGDFVLVLLRPGQGLDVLDADAMAAAGWHKKPF